MTAVAFVAAVAGIAYGWQTDNPWLIIFGFWVALLGCFLLGTRETPEERADRLTVPSIPCREAWGMFDDIYALPTAAHGSYPAEEDVL